MAASFLTLSVGAAQAAPFVLDCTPGSSGSASVSIAAGGLETLQVSNAAGSTIAFTAALGNSAGTGALKYSMGGDILTFPSQTSATISTALSSPTWLILESADSAVTVTATCNPAAAQPGTVSEVSENPASSTALVRQQAIDTLKSMAMAWVVEISDFEGDFDFAVSVLNKDPALVAALFSDRARGVSYAAYVGWLVTRYEQRQKKALGQIKTSSEWIEREISDLEAKLLALETEYLQERGGALPYVAASADSPAVAAINRAAGSDVVSGTFNVLGYGPSGRFDSSTVLAQGRNWKVVAAAFGAISQANLAAGDIRSVSGRGTINIVTSPAANVGLGLSLGIGATSEDGVSLDERAYHYFATGVATYKLSPNLTLDGVVGYELTSHNYTSSTGAGTSASYLYTAGLGLEGSFDLNEYKLAPRLDVELAHEHADAVTLSDGTVLNGFDRTTGKAIIGGQVSRDYLWMNGNELIVVTPSVGADANLSVTQKTTTAGVTSSSTLLGGGLSAGLALAFEDGLDVSLSTRVTYSGDTTGASLTGGIGGSF